MIAILTALTFVSLPVIGSLSKASARRAAANLVHAALDQARAMAVSQSAIHYVVFADSDPAWPESCRYRAFATFRELFDPETNRYDRFAVGAWSFLPEGISFKPDLANETTVFSSTRESFYCQPASSEVPVVCFKFNTVGGLDQPLRPNLAKLCLFEGYVAADGRPVPSSKAPREEWLRLSLATGRVEREEAKISTYEAP